MVIIQLDDAVSHTTVFLYGSTGRELFLWSLLTGVVVLSSQTITATVRSASKSARILDGRGMIRVVRLYAPLFAKCNRNFVDVSDTD